MPSGTSTPPASAFTDNFSSFDTAVWHASNWNNGDYFVNAWHPNQVTFPNLDHLELTLEPDTQGLTSYPAISGEYSTNRTYGFGLFKTRLKASSVPGTITAFFTYVGGDSGNQHDEIDIEIKGDDPTKLQINYWTDSVEHPTLINLGFDASEAYHDYAFKWTSTGIDWFVDNKLIHSENGSLGPLPTTPGQIILNYWGVQGAINWSSDYIATTPASSISFKNLSYKPLA